MSRWSPSRKATASAPRPRRAELGVVLSAALPPHLCAHRSLPPPPSPFFLFSLSGPPPPPCLNAHAHAHTPFLTISFMFAYRFFGVVAAQTENVGLTLWLEGAS